MKKIHWNKESLLIKKKLRYETRMFDTKRNSLQKTFIDRHKTVDIKKVYRYKKT